jgi:hypothetical protein
MLIIVMSITDQVIMRQTKSLVHFEILYVYSKVSFEEKLSPGVLDLCAFLFKQNNFSIFEKML